MNPPDFTGGSVTGEVRLLRGFQTGAAGASAMSASRITQWAFTLATHLIGSFRLLNVINGAASSALEAVAQTPEALRSRATEIKIYK
ncbi:hypothetical protein [Mycobacterium sp. 1465703.0]|uniref:hypothetical protein n=1 Tax=Mycobacterium sp. 1465703.0 TaxID=1834078 RepID=UPI0012E9F1DB|nr:hypothetical protein [Mycobacterium sp. 1465703.0]